MCLEGFAVQREISAVSGAVGFPDLPAMDNLTLVLICARLSQELAALLHLLLPLPCTWAELIIL